MKQKLVMAAVVSVTMASGLVAQGGGLSTAKCPRGATALSPETIAQDACQQAYDIYQFMSPQLGLALTGGNATAGQGGVLGGLGHFSVGVRANVFEGKLPQVDQFQQSTSGAQQRSLPVSNQFLGLPTADAAIGIFKGLPLAVTNVGGIDGLVSVSYVPTIHEDNIRITPDQNLKVGWGARLGLLSESIVVPAVSLTWVERDLPTTTIEGTAGNNTLLIQDLSVKTNAWRLVVSKSLIMFNVAAGVGQDRYKQSADISATVRDACAVTNCTVSVNDTEQDLTRTNAFIDFGLNLPFVKLVLEGGQASGGTVQTYNSFAGTTADRSQLYGSLGLRFGF
jgi:hypothetical protein